MNTADNGKEGLSLDRPARTIVRRLVDSRSAEGPDRETSTRAAAGDHLHRELSRWVGTDGCHALFTRALAEARTDYPLLGKIELRAGSDPYIGCVPETVAVYGDAGTAKALESMLIHLVELLGRLIGDDMATKLIERSSFASERANLTSRNRREEA
jgi:hypothetical protein